MKATTGSFAGNSRFLANDYFISTVPNRKSPGAFEALRQVSALFEIQESAGKNFQEVFASLSSEQQKKIQEQLGDHSLQEIQSLSQEKDPVIFFRGLQEVSRHLEDDGRLPAAIRLHQFLAARSSVPQVAQASRDRLEAMQGAGPTSIRAEMFLNRLSDEAGNPAVVAGFGLASTLYRVTRLGMMTQLLAEPASFWTRGIMAEAAAGSFAYLFEAPSFVLGTKGAEQLLGEKPDWTGEGFRQEISHAYLTFLPLKAAGFAVERLSARFVMGNDLLSRFSRSALPQAGLWVGILGGMKLAGNPAGALGSRQDWLGESLEMLVNFNVAGLLSRRLLGPGFARWENQMDLQTQFLQKNSVPLSFPMQNIFDPSLAFAGAFSAGGRSLYPKIENPVILMSENKGNGNGRDPEGTRYNPLNPAAIVPAASGRAEPQVAQEPFPYQYQTIDGRYRIDGKLGAGGMGIVLAATRIEIDKKVAVKVLRADISSNPDASARFLNEARLVSTIKNPHIIEIFDFGRLPDGLAYYVMEHLEGLPLDKVIDDGGPVPVAQIIHVGRQIAEGLEAAHQAGIVHRDLKPENIFLVNRGSEKDFVKILDFGLAKAPDLNSRMTVAGTVFGSPAYMSPEQAMGNEVDFRSDIYSFGITLYEMASGKLPFEAANAQALYQQHIVGTPLPLRQRDPRISPGLEAIVQRCMEKDPNKRFQSMQEVITAFDKLKKHLISTTDFSNSMLSSTTRTVPKKPWPWIAGIGGTTVLATGLAAFLLLKKNTDSVSVNATGSQGPGDAASVPSVAPPKEVPQKEITLSFEPANAHVFQGDEDLGVSPLKIKIKADSPLDLEIRRDGFITKAIHLDGSIDRPTFRLDPEPKVKPRPPILKPPPSASVQPKPKGSENNVVDPWKKRP